MAEVLSLIGLYIFIDFKLSKQRFVLRSVCFGIFAFFSAFLIVSEILFACGAYSLQLTLGICSGIGVLGLFAIFLVKIIKGRSSGRFPLREDKISIKLPRAFYISLIGLTLASILFTCVKFDIFGMGQDQGVYQMTAILRTAGYDGIALDLNGYHTLAAFSAQDAELYAQSVNAARYGENGPDGNLRGFYTGSPDNQQPEAQSPVSGFMHGLPNFSALLSISGIIFGIPGLLHIQTLFLAVSVCLLFMTLFVNLKLKLPTAVIAAGLFILSPIVIWTARASLTECFTTLIMTAFIFLITSPDTYASRLLWLPVAVFAFFHVSIYTMMPLFVILFLFLYIQRRDSAIIVSGAAALLAFAAGFLAMLRTSSGYVIDNYRRLRGIVSFLGLKDDGFILFVVAVAIAAAALLIVSGWLIKRFDIRLNGKIFLLVSKYAMLICFAYIILAWLMDLIGETDLSGAGVVVKGLVSSAPNVTLGSYAVLTGCIALPAVMLALFMKNKIFAEGGAAALVVVFLYCVMIYSAFLRKNTSYFYYFARYLAPFIPVILTLAGVYIDTLNVKAVSVITAVSAALLLPFSFFAVFRRDLSNIDSKAFVQVTRAVQELDSNDIVIVSKENMSLFFIPLDYMAQCLILPPGENYSITEERIASQSGDVYLLTIDTDGNTFETSKVFAAASGRYYSTSADRLMPLPMTGAREEYLIELRKLT